jgi:DNA repair exonuclease SbcCD ATPase subunit
MNEKSKQTEADNIEKLRNFKGMIVEGDHAKESLKSLKQKIEDITPYTQVMVTDEVKALENRYSELMEKISEERNREVNFNQATFYLNNVVLKDFSEKQKELRNRHVIEQEQARGQANLDRMVYETAENSFKTYEESKARYDEILVSLTEQKTNTAFRIGNLLETNKELSLKLLYTEEAKRALKSFTSCSFDDALSEISDMATRIIRNIPNMANSTIQLEGVKETKEGKLKEEVNAVISSDGEIGIPIKSLSGGERSAVDLAIDLAIINMLEQRTGRGANIFILDEPFTGLDSVSIEMTLEMLKNSNINKKLILVDHNPEVKQMIDDKITVIRDGSSSRIEQ